MLKLVLIGFSIGMFLPKAATEERAIQINCPSFTIIATPADGHVSMARAKALAECLDDEASHICTIQTVALRRGK